MLNVGKSLSFASAADMDNPALSGSKEDHIPLADGKLKLCWTGDFTCYVNCWVSMLRSPVFGLLLVERKFIVSGHHRFRGSRIRNTFTLVAAKLKISSIRSAQLSALTEIAIMKWWIKLTQHLITSQLDHVHEVDFEGMNMD